MKSFLIFKHKTTGIWQGRCKDGSKTLWTKSLKTKLKNQASKWKALQETDRFRLPDEKPSGSGKRIDQAFKDQEKLLHQLYKKPKTLDTYLNWLKKFRVFILGELKLTLLEEINSEHIQLFSAWLQNNNSSKYAYSVYNHIALTFDKWVEVQKWLPENPFRNKSIKKPKQTGADTKERNFWDQNEISTIIDLAPSLEIKAFWAVQAFAGLRFDEARLLEKQEVFLSTGRLLPKSKMGKRVWVPINKFLAPIITEWAESSKRKKGGYLFNGLTNINNFKLNSILKKATKDLVFKDGGTANHHRFRHSFGSNLIRNGANIKSVQRLLRHSNISLTLDIYTHLLEDDFVADSNLVFVKSKAEKQADILPLSALSLQS